MSRLLLLLLRVVLCGRHRSFYSDFIRQRALSMATLKFIVNQTHVLVSKKGNKYVFDEEVAHNPEWCRTDLVFGCLG